MKATGSYFVVACFALSVYVIIAQDILSQWHINCLWLGVCMWILCDGALVALDLRASEQIISILKDQVRHLSLLDTENSDIIRKLNENHTLLLEIRAGAVPQRKLHHDATNRLSLSLNDVSDVSFFAK